jgi:alcohol dehydrogenase (cytochrome c)
MWRYPQVGQGDFCAGTLTTAGGLLFLGTMPARLEALEASTGQPLWHCNTGQGIRACPITYAIDDGQ